MIYKFTFWNSYSYCLILAFWERNVSKLAQQLGTILIIKQLMYNLIEYLQNRVFVGIFKKNSVGNRFKTLIKDLKENHPDKTKRI